MAKVLRCQLLAALASVASGIYLQKNAASAADDHPWPTSRGPHLKQFGLTNVVVPHDLSASLAWSWQHPDGQYHTVLCGGPVIDAAGNFYFTANDGVRKLSPTGQTLWHFKQQDNMINNQPALLGDKLFGNNQHGIAFAVDLKTGASVWSKQLAQTAGGDCGYPAAYDGVFAVGAESGSDPAHPGGNSRVFGLDAASGSTLWEFKPHHPVWNFAPLFPGDDTCVFMDFAGGMYSVGLHNGTQLWYVPSPGASKSFSDGGATLGPNGAVYSCSNPGSDGGSEGSKGLLRALRLADGALMWQQLLPQPCNSYPAVGPLAQGQGLSVAVTPGSFMGQPNLHGSIMAFDATTGALEWRFNTKPYTGPFNMARGDVEGYQDRNEYDKDHAICLPAHWSAANIAGDGTVLAARSDGYVYAVRGPALPGPAASLAEVGADFESTPGTTARLWDAKGASLHGAFAFAPGTMAVQTCDTLYVFRV
mmetsp:Transcript_4137/g.12094  ORF Transcript_4137/g.12094 Transcript_4137/m.12094 type:complete len:476 (-) Transcript_4137:68-1495(-)